MIDNRGINEGLFQNILAGANSMPALKTMGISLTYLGQGTAGLKVICPHEYANHMGSVHGAVISGLLDNAMGYSIETLNKRCVTLEMNLNYIMPVLENTEITVEGFVIHTGNKTAVAEASLFTHEHKLAVKARATFYILPGTVEDRVW
jgi:uncharacterized domain 1